MPDIYIGVGTVRRCKKGDALKWCPRPLSCFTLRGVESKARRSSQRGGATKADLQQNDKFPMSTPCATLPKGVSRVDSGVKGGVPNVYHGTEVDLPGFRGGVDRV